MKAQRGLGNFRQLLPHITPHQRVLVNMLVLLLAGSLVSLANPYFIEGALHPIDHPINVVFVARVVIDLDGHVTPGVPPDLVAPGP